ncbi:MAG: AAA family ATPase [Clostridia bacterium]|nr:AAA family ATPase [Clostridia bacterium]
MSYRDFKKQIQKRKEQEETLRAINGALNSWKKKRDTYAQTAKECLKRGDQSQYRTTVSLLKNAMFHLARTEDMLTNFNMARDMCEAQQLNKQYLGWFDSMMKDLNKTCKSISADTSGKLFMKAVSRQTDVSEKMREMFRANDVAFACSVNALSDIDDDDVREVLQVEMGQEEIGIDSSLADLEKEFLGEVAESAAEGQRMAEGGPAERKSEESRRPFSREEKREPAPTRPERPETPNAGPAPRAEEGTKPEKETTPEDLILEGGNDSFEFNWDDLPNVKFDDIAGLDKVKEAVKIKVLLPLQHPEAFEGYEKKGGDGLCLYGPPGTGKTMIAAAIASEIGAKFCSVKPSDLLQTGVGNSEKAIRTLFAEARRFPCAVIYFDEMDSLTPKVTRATHAKQMRSEFLSQLQGIDSYKGNNDNILFLVAATNKPWDIDSAFLRPGRFGTKIYVGLPDADARAYIINKRLDKIRKRGIVSVSDEIDVPAIVEATNGYNCSDISGLMNRIEEISVLRGVKTGSKVILPDDVTAALQDVRSSVQSEDIQRLKAWRDENDN